MGVTEAEFCGQGVVPVRFVTDDLPERERLPRYAEVFGRLIARFDIEPAAGVPFRGETLACDLPELGLVTCFLSGARGCRRAPGCRAGLEDGILLLRPVGGPLRVNQRGQDVAVGDGDAVLVSLDDALACDFSAVGRVDCLRLSRRALACMIGDVDAVLLRPVSGEVAAMQLLVYYGGALLRGLMRLPSADHARLAAGHMRDLVGMMFRALGAPSPAAGRQARLAAIKADVEACLGEREVSAAALAARHGISARYVQKLFEAEQTTFSAYVLGRRLDRARQLIAGEAGRPISAIAYDVGFGDLSYFNRTFRRRFGMAPSRLRRARAL